MKRVCSLALLLLLAAVGARGQVSILVPASAATVVAPMTYANGIIVSNEPTNLAGGSSYASVPFTLAAPVSTLYVWFYEIAPTANQDSFWISLDGGTNDIFDTGGDCAGAWGVWQWKRLIGRGPSNILCSLNPRTFTNVPAGNHVLKVQAREQNSQFATVWFTDSTGTPPTATPTPPPATMTPTATPTITASRTPTSAPPTATPAFVPTMTLPQNVNYINTRLAAVEKAIYCDTCECPTCPTRTPMPTPAP